jgi:septal ring factor EnvC (AmiA/AmiB activator)
MFEVRTGATFEDSRRAYADDLKKFESAIRKTTDLFMRVNTNGAELVASIRFAHADLVRSRAEKPSEMDVLREVMEWKKRRRPALDEQMVASHIRNLAALGWLDVTASPDLPLPEDELAEFAEDL